MLVVFIIHSWLHDNNTTYFTFVLSLTDQMWRQRAKVCLYYVTIFFSGVDTDDYGTVLVLFEQYSPGGAACLHTVSILETSNINIPTFYGILR